MKAVTKSDWLVPMGLIALTLVPMAAGIVRLLQVTGGAAVTAENARFMTAPVPVIVHILSVLPFCIFGALQFSGGLRSRLPVLHRTMGRVLVPLGLAAAGSGLWMTLTYPWPPGDGVVLYYMRIVVGVLMLGFIAVGFMAALGRNYRSHSAWMTRGYALGLGAGTQVLTHVPWFLLVGKPDEVARIYLMGAGWVINLLVAEWVIHRRLKRG